MSFITQDLQNNDITIGGDQNAKLVALLSIRLVKIPFLNWRSILMY